MTPEPSDDNDDDPLGGYESLDRIGDDRDLTPAQIAVLRAAHALLLAVVEEECDARVHDLLCSSDTTPGFLIEVAHTLAHFYVESFGHGHEQMRADLIEDLHRLAEM